MSTRPAPLPHRSLPPSRGTARIPADTLPLFAAIDFETANDAPHSACAVGLVVVRQGRAERSLRRLLRPPAGSWIYSRVHGIREQDVAASPSFAEAWPAIESMLEGTAFLAAHNARFDRAVLHQCCAEANFHPPEVPFVCTMEIARRSFGPGKLGLSQVCRRLGIPLDHHDPLSDASAAAAIVLAAHHAGWNWKP